MSKEALIGHTGFVGGTLLRERGASATYNSSNIESIRGRRFDRIICAGVSAAKWIANREPDKDWRSIARLIGCLETVETDHFVLVSTIDVYRDLIAQTERVAPQTEGLHPYGLHRLWLEQFVAARFPSRSIVRLPALFGAGLKKNALYDMIALNQIDRIAPNAVYQWYPTRQLCSDLDRIFAAGLELINIVSAPIRMEEIRARFFPRLEIGGPSASPPIYDVRTEYAHILGGKGAYHLEAEPVLQDMGVFVEEARRS